MSKALGMALAAGLLLLSCMDSRGTEAGLATQAESSELLANALDDLKIACYESGLVIGRLLEAHPAQGAALSPREAVVIDKGNKICGQRRATPTRRKHP